MKTSYGGGCACGAIRYQADGEAINPHYCHCRQCQRSVGAPLVAWVNFAASGFRWTQGQPNFYASSAAMRRGFCAQCGTSLCSLEEDGYVCVTITSLGRADELAPQYHIYVRYSLPWLQLNDGLPREHREDRA